MTSLLIGPSNSAGQATAWARAVTSELGFPAHSYDEGRLVHALTRRQAFGRRTDLHVPHRRAAPRRWHDQRVLQLMSGCSHLLIESFTRPFVSPASDGLQQDVRRLREMGVDVALVAHGSDLRGPDTHVAHVPDSYFSVADADWVARFRTISSVNRELAATLALEWGTRLFVTTPDLLWDAPEATWLPVVVDARAWAVPRPPTLTGRPTVLHIPSRRVPPVKGTDLIEPVLRDLDRRGLIRALLPDAIAHEAMRSVVTSADIVVDQTRSGAYGVTAVEAMAAGRLVIAAVHPDVRDRIDVPIPISDVAGSLATAIESILDDRAAATMLAAQGPGYVAAVHSGARSARVLASFVMPS